MATEQPPPSYNDVLLEKGLNTSLGARQSSAQSNKILKVETKGVDWGSLPFVRSQRKTNILDENSSPVYVSTLTSSAPNAHDCILSSPGKGDILSTRYHSLRSTELRYCSPEASSKRIPLRTGYTKHGLGFEAPNGKTYAWESEEHKSTNTKITKLVPVDPYGGSRALATLIRSHDTVPQGASAWHPGVGGQLVISSEASGVVDEPLIVASLLAVLKMEAEDASDQVAADKGIRGGQTKRKDYYLSWT